MESTKLLISETELVFKEILRNFPLHAFQEANLIKNEFIESTRLFHGRGQLFPGLTFLAVDLFYPFLRVVYFEKPSLLWHQEFICAAKQFCEQHHLNALVLQSRYKTGVHNEILWGSLNDDPLARAGGLIFQIDLLRNQNAGFFLDMKPGHDWLRQRASGKKILNMFAYTCAFSVVAKAGGAQSVLNVDMNKQALAIGQKNHQRNNLSLSGVEFLSYDIFKSIGKLKRRGPYDIVICDPPSYQKGSFIAKKDYPRLAKHFNDLVMPGGDLLICLNSPDLDTRFITEFMTELAPSFCFTGRLENSRDFPELNLERGLKLMVYRYSLDNNNS